MDGMGEIYRQLVTESQRLERVTIVGHISLFAAVSGALFEDGWRVTRSGPYTDEKMFPKADTSRFLFIAERPLGEC